MRRYYTPGAQLVTGSPNAINVPLKALTLGSFAPTVSIISAGSPGFTAQSGFSVTAASFSHDQPMVVSRTSGTWAARQYGTAPWIYDTTDRAVYNGTIRTPFAGYTDGQVIPFRTGVTGRSWVVYGNDSPDAGLVPQGYPINYSTSRPQ